MVPGPVPALRGRVRAPRAAARGRAAPALGGRRPQPATEPRTRTARRRRHRAAAHRVASERSSTAQRGSRSRCAQGWIVAALVSRRSRWCSSRRARAVEGRRAAPPSSARQGRARQGHRPQQRDADAKAAEAARHRDRAGPPQRGRGAGSCRTTPCSTRRRRHLHLHEPQAAGLRPRADQRGSTSTATGRSFPAARRSGPRW